MPLRKWPTSLPLCISGVLTMALLLRLSPVTTGQHIGIELLTKLCRISCLFDFSSHAFYPCDLSAYYTMYKCCASMRQTPLTGTAQGHREISPMLICHVSHQARNVSYQIRGNSPSWRQNHQARAPNRPQILSGKMAGLGIIVRPRSTLP